jgi:serine/threonine-protein kinase
MIGSVVGNYRVVEKLGEGGMGAVYKAVDLMLEREVALKFLRPEFAGRPELAERFRTEAVILARLNHPHIATLYGLSREGDQLFMVMEFVHGETLERLLERQGRVAPAAAVGWCCEVLEAMQYAHRRGVVHRDIKPANVMVTDEGGVKVMDFGIARVLGSAHQTRLGHVIGTACYMAPEQIRGQEVDGRTDLYALGIVLYQLVTGRTPFQGPDEFAIMTAQVTEAPVPPSRLIDGVPSWLDDAVLRALAKAPGDRFQSAADFRRTLLGGLKTLGLADPELEPSAAAPAALSPPSAAADSQEPPLDLVPESRLAEAEAYESAVQPPPTRQAETPPSTRLAVTPPPTRAATPPEDPSPAPSDALPRVAGRIVALGALAIVVIPGLVLWLTLHPAGPAARQASAPPPSVSAGSAAESHTSAASPEPTASSQPSPARPADIELPADRKPAAEVETRNRVEHPVTFDGLELVQDTDQVDVVLKLFSDHLTITSEHTGVTLKNVSYRSIAGAAYEETRETKQKPGFFHQVLSKLGAGKHWLTLQTGGGVIVLHLGRAYNDILPVLERLAGVKIAKGAK